MEESYALVTATSGAMHQSTLGDDDGGTSHLLGARPGTSYEVTFCTTVNVSHRIIVYYGLMDLCIMYNTIIIRHYYNTFIMYCETLLAMEHA